jgi:hypothetical protein
VEVSSDILHAVAPLRHKSALPVLLALESKPCGTAELAERLTLAQKTPIAQKDLDYVVQMLSRAGLVATVRVEPADERARTNRRIYGTKHVGWQRVLQALEDLESRSTAP